MNDLKYIIESLLFVAEQPVTVESLKCIFPTTETKVIRSTLAGLVEEYNNHPRGFYLKEIAGGYQFRSRPEYQDYIKRFTQAAPPRLSRPALETLAIIAYKQPIIRADIEHIRGVDSGGVLRMLMERKLIRVLGRKEIPGRPLIYATTKKFLEVFDLKDLKDLPSPKEIAELSEPGIEEETETGPPEDPSQAPQEESAQGAAPEAEEGGDQTRQLEATMPQPADEPSMEAAPKTDPKPPIPPSTPENP